MPHRRRACTLEQVMGDMHTPVLGFSFGMPGIVFRRRKAFKPQPDRRQLLRATSPRRVTNSATGVKIGFDTMKIGIPL
jgi:hypothetical protein